MSARAGKEKLVKRLEQVCDWIVENQQEDGQIGLKDAHFIYVAGYNMRAIAAAFRITKKRKYLECVQKWLDLVFSQQLENGSLYANTVQLKDAYGRLISDASNALNVIFNLWPYFEDGRKAVYEKGLDRFVEWFIDGEEGRSFILENGACGCGIYRDNKEKGRPECLECTLIILDTLLLPYARLKADGKYLSIARRGIQYALSKQTPEGVYPYISKSMFDPPQGDRILHVLHYVLEGYIHFLEFSGIEFFDPLAVQIREAIRKGVIWILDNQTEAGRWGVETRGNDAAKSGGMVPPLQYFLRIAPQEPSYAELVPRVEKALEKAEEFLLSEAAVDDYGIVRLERQNGFGGMALAELIEPYITYDIGPLATVVFQADAFREVLPSDILQKLPKAEPPFAGMEGWVHQNRDTQVVFWASEEGCESPLHEHPYDEWCVILHGSATITMDGDTKTCFAGDTLYIKANRKHKVVTSKNYRSIDLFDSPDHIMTQ